MSLIDYADSLINIFMDQWTSLDSRKGLVAPDQNNGSKKL